MESLFILNFEKLTLMTGFVFQGHKLEWFLKDHDTEDWSNIAENSTLPSH